MTIPGGYILISRKLIESEIYNKPPLYMKVWIYLLSEAKFKRTDRLERGQLYTTLSEIQEACSWYVGYRKETPSKSKIYRVIDWLRKTGERVHEQDMTDKMIETTKVTQGMVITVVNYDYYQAPENYERNTDRNDEQGTNATRPKQQRNNRLKERNKNVNKNGKKEKVATPKFTENDKPYQLAVKLRNLILENNPRENVPEENPKDLEHWSIEIDRLNRLGPIGASDKGYSWQEIENIIEWSQQDSFWYKNIKSGGKLREQITKLEDQMKSDNNYNKKKTGQNWDVIN